MGASPAAMASPLPTAKRTVDLKAPPVRESRIRRDPPPPKPVKEITLADRDDRNRRAAMIGIVAFALALTAIIIGVSSYLVGWKPSEYTIEL